MAANLWQEPLFVDAPWGQRHRNTGYPMPTMCRSTRRRASSMKLQNRAPMSGEAVEQGSRAGGGDAGRFFLRLLSLCMAPLTVSAALTCEPSSNLESEHRCPTRVRGARVSFCNVLGSERRIKSCTLFTDMPCMKRVPKDKSATVH